LQLDVIERALQLWSRPDDVVLSPFMGIGSEGHSSLLMGRKFIGMELKESYFDYAVKNLEIAADSFTQKLF
jgi:DNA modification methylase